MMSMAIAKMISLNPLKWILLDRALSILQTTIKELRVNYDKEKTKQRSSSITPL